MTHLAEDDLILRYYGEDGGAGTAHLASCAPCAAAYASLAADLDAIRPEDLAADDLRASRMWTRVERSLPAARRPFTAWTAGLAAAAAILLAFWLGRSSAPLDTPSPAPQRSAEEVRERILLVAVGDHLERAQTVLLEIVNAPEGAAVDLSASQRSAQELASANRLYRQAAAQADEAGMTSVLDELERVLVEVAHSDAPLSSSSLDHLRRRIESKGLLFRVRVIGSQVREKQKDADRGNQQS
ncbi:MAG: hypothetical protein ABW221_06485 [Vicinamibacteria bacterium]